MVKGLETKQRIIEKAANLFLSKGYHNTAISDILEETDLPKGSFYYHFKSKQDVGIAVAAYYQEQYEEWFEKVASCTDDYHNFILGIVNDIHKKISDKEYAGCPYTCFGTEASAVDSEIAAALKSGIESFLLIFENVFIKSGFSAKQAKYKAGIALGIYEGFLVYYRITREEEIIEQMKKALLVLEV